MTVILLAVVGYSGLSLIPPMYQAYQQNKQVIIDTDTELTKQKKLLAAVTAVKSNPDQLDTLYDKARLSLPETADSDILMLQLDGLLKSIALSDATIDVPLVSAKAEPGETATGNNLEAKISGDIDFGQAITLLRRLKTLSRWNTIKSFSISISGDKFSTNVSFIGSFKPGAAKEFSGNQNLLSQAEDIFRDFDSYAKLPDPATEGDYGKDNPFSP
ncbi:MAG: hypothetical protein WD970_01815 [Patescibacteria group bacterium]